jgi:hypothetical protein
MVFATNCIALCAGVFMAGSCFGWVMTPEPAEFKLAKIRSS